MNSTLLKSAGLTAALLAGGCVSVPSQREAWHTQVIQTWVGQSSAQLWASWGPPLRQVRAADGFEYHVYQQRIGKPYGEVDRQTELLFAQSSDPQCTTYFAIDPRTQRISKASWRGRRCPLYPPQSSGLLPRSIQPTGF
jgi:hypothetical protein